jgi:hypothetical protein
MTGATLDATLMPETPLRGTINLKRYISDLIEEGADA